MECQRAMRIENTLRHARCSRGVTKAYRVVLECGRRNERRVGGIHHTFKIVVQRLVLSLRTGYNDDALRLETGGDLLPQRQENFIDDHEAIARMTGDARD